MLKKIGILFSGTLIAQLIPFLSLPFITKLFTPEEFGEYSLYLIALGIGVIFATLRLELAIPIMNERNIEKNLNNLISITIFNALLMGFLFFIFLKIGDTFKLYSDFLLTLLYILSVMIIGSYQIYYQAGIRASEFKKLSFNKWISQLVLAVILLSFGIAFNSFMIIALVLSQIIWLFLLYLQLKIKFSLHLVNINSVSLLIKEYKKFPQLQLPIQFLSTVSANSMMLTISFLYSSTELGFYSLIERFLRSPLNVLGSVTSDIFKNIASKEIREKGTAVTSYFKIISFNIITGAIIFASLYYGIEYIIASFFGGEWAESAIYAKILMPSFFSMYVVFPITYIYILYDLQSIDIKIQLVQLIIIMIWVFYSIFSKLDIKNLLMGYSLIVIIMSIFIGGIGLYIVRFRNGVKL